MTDAFPQMPSGYPFPELEREILDFWEAERIFEKTLEATRAGERFVFYEGPPTANNKPHIGHVVTRVVKDLLPRYKTMQGLHVARKAGWDTHGLPVEIEVEKALGFSGKKDIERYGVERFNRACLESVHTYERQWREMTRRVGFWVDLDEAYFTYTNEYVESVWWALAELDRKGLLSKGHKIQPYCARCGTTLSSHEVAQNYQEAEDPSIWTLFRVRQGQERAGLDGNSHDLSGVGLVGWTTTPWTTLANAAVAVHPELVYRLVASPRDPDERLLIGDDLATAVPVEIRSDAGTERLDLRDQPALARFRGADLEDLAYARLFEYFEPGLDGRVVLADHVTATEGTGMVHTAPPFGDDDYRTGQRYELPMMLTVTAEGRIADGAGELGGLWFKDADRPILRDLRQRGLLLHAERYRHNYPFCWRCDQPLLYYASESWFVRTTKHQEDLIAANADEIRWSPEHVGTGRFGNWLETLVDWALSRKRYWGTPLPVWECDSCSATRVIGSYRELFEAAGCKLPADPYDREQFDPHRPFVDRDHERFTWSCPECEDGSMGRVEDVIDAWFDSGSMPFAQHHYMGESLAEFAPDAGRGFPADFISEAVDQTRGWFYTLHALGVLLFGRAAYRNCVVLGHVNDETGRKMSKRLGNVVDPMEVLEQTGADALRWYFFVSNPEVNSRFSARLVREAAQKFLIPLWNAASFFSIYANLDGWRPTSESSEGSEAPAFEHRPALDRWILLRLERLTATVSGRLDGYAIAEAAREIERFVDQLTNWYIRRSRDRFWAPAERDPADKESAYQTLYSVLRRLTILVAPFTPFVAEALHRRLVFERLAGSSESVHLESWPEADAGLSEPDLERAMDAVLDIVALGRAARNDHQLKTRQPLASVTVVTADVALRPLLDGFLDILREELNVHDVRWADDRADYVHHEVRPNFSKCGPRFGKQMKAVQRALAEADGDELAAGLEAQGSIAISVDGEEVVLRADELEIRLIEKEGLATAADRNFLVALDTRLTETLIAEGRAREIVHRVQARRKELDLDYADRIQIRYRADGEIERVLDDHRDWISGETLATGWSRAREDEELTPAAVEGLEFAFELEVTTRAEPTP